jgi:hypothetical protein
MAYWLALEGTMKLSSRDLQSLQRKGKFGDAKYIASFASYHGAQALLLGVWKIEGEVPAMTAPTVKLELTEHFGWSTEKQSYYEYQITHITGQVMLYESSFVKPNKHSVLFSFYSLL